MLLPNRGNQGTNVAGDHATRAIRSFHPNEVHEVPFHQLPQQPREDELSRDWVKHIETGRVEGFIPQKYN